MILPIVTQQCGLETKSEERLYRPFTESLLDNPTGLDELLDTRNQALPAWF
jgi:hypothetical protein